MSNTTVFSPSAKTGIKIESVSNSFSITNNAQLAIVVIDAYATDAKDTSLFFNCSLSSLTATDGALQIKSGETKTFSHGTANALDRSIIIARADNLFPVKIIELGEDADSFPDSTVSTDDLNLMMLAERFVQAIIAFPSSKMATDFAAVLPTNDEQKIASFFASYGRYATISLDHVVAIQSYYNRYAFVWAGYGATQTFDIYTSNAGTTKKNLGTLTISSLVTAPVTNLDAPAGFTAVYMDQNHRKTNLVYKNGQFSEDPSSAAPKVCLQALFILLSQLTGADGDNRIVPAVYGQVNGATIFGVSSNYTVVNTMSVSSTGVSAVTSDIKDYFDSLGLWGWLKLAGILVGAIAGLAVLAVTARYIYKKVKKSSLTPEEIKRLNEQRVTQTLERMADAGVKLPEDLTVSLKDIKAQADANLLLDSKSKIERILQKQYNETVKMMEYGNTAELQSTFESLDWDKISIQTNDPKVIADNIDSMREHIVKNSKVLADHVKTIKKLSTADAKMISDAKELADSLTKAVDTNEKIREDLLDDELPEIIEE